MGSAVDGQKQSHGVLGNGVGGVGRHPEDPELSLAGLDVYIVETGAAQNDGFHTQLVELIHHHGVYGVVDEDADRVKAGGQGGGVPVQVGLKILDFHTGGNAVAVKTGDVVGFGIKKCKLHNAFLLHLSIALYRIRIKLSIGILRNFVAN